MEEWIEEVLFATSHAADTANVKKVNREDTSYLYSEQWLATHHPTLKYSGGGILGIRVGTEKLIRVDEKMELNPGKFLKKTF